jgi:hypothetical protein
VECPEMNGTELQIVRRQARKLSPVSHELMRHLARAIGSMTGQT